MMNSKEAGHEVDGGLQMKVSYQGKMKKQTDDEDDSGNAEGNQCRW